MRTVGWVISLVTLFGTATYGQPFRYSAVPIDDRGNSIIERTDLLTGGRRTLTDSVGRVVQLWVSNDSTFLVLQIRSSLEVLPLDSLVASHPLLDNVEWVHEVIHAPSVDRLFASIGTVDRCSATIVFDTRNWTKVDSIQGFWSPERAVLSQDGESLYRLESQSRIARFKRFRATNGEESGVVLLPLEMPIAYKPLLLDGRSGVALLSVEFSPGGFSNQQLLVFDLDSMYLLSSFSVPYRCNAILSADTRRVLVESVVYDSSASMGEVHTGRIEVYKCNTGILESTVELRPNGHLIAAGPFPILGYYVPQDDGGGIPIRIADNVLPQVDLLHPQMALAKAGGLEIRISGSGFASGAAVLWNGLPRTTTFKSSSQVLVTIPSADLAVPETASVVVRNPNGQVSTKARFVVVAALPAPVRPFLDCVAKIPGRKFVAWFGYDNANDVAVGIPVGRQNNISPGSANLRQTTVFLPGRHPRAFSITFQGDDLVWWLNGGRATASRRSPPCP
jgi:hypothetical protein